MLSTRPATTLVGRLGGIHGNEILTSATGAVLTVVLVVEGITLLRFRQLIGVHMFVGVVLIPVLAVKLASTGWRMARYYLHAPAYVHKGPPLLPLRLLAPPLVLTTVVILATGVWLMFLGHHSDTLLTFHKVSFIVWSALFAAHFLSYLPRVVRSLRTDWSAARRSNVPGAGLRGTFVVLALALGVALAIAVLPTIGAYHQRHDHHHDEGARVAVSRRA